MSLASSVPEKLPDWLLRTPVVAELLDRRAREVAAERQGLADQLATIARELDEGATAYTKTIAPLTAKATAAREALQIAASALLAQRQAYELVVHSCEARRTRLERQLTASAPPEINAAITALDRRFDAARGRLYQSKALPLGTHNLKSGKDNEVTVSNEPGIRRLSDDLVTARRALEGLKTSPFTGPVLAEAIAAIVDRVDWDVDHFEPIA